MFFKKFIAGAIGLPFGLMLVLITGGELFTGNTFLTSSSYLHGKTTLKELRKSWVVSYLGNFIGALLMCVLVFYSKTLGTGGAAINLAVKKTQEGSGTMVVRGAMCNYLVCLGEKRDEIVDVVKGRIIMRVYF